MQWWMKFSLMSVLWMIGGGLLGFLASVVYAIFLGIEAVAEHGRRPGDDPLVGLVIVWALLLAPLATGGGMVAGSFCRVIVVGWTMVRSRRSAPSPPPRNADGFDP